MHTIRINTYNLCMHAHIYTYKYTYTHKYIHTHHTYRSRRETHCASCLVKLPESAPVTSGRGPLPLFCCLQCKSYYLSTCKMELGKAW